ncbi:hypothetical protein B0T22DRAFT_125271 [Podospora appendiculata]|uniref:Uncharacterized protein n=1 Tax=Podospora appendiculata TaxID=314037 RepID=A0AAE0X717_9PEZI|nr:hypothetical protein B0T22DRAFT_125271 [Podospora appendiculata]
MLVTASIPASLPKPAAVSELFQSEPRQTGSAPPITQHLGRFPGRYRAEHPEESPAQYPGQDTARNPAYYPTLDPAQYPAQPPAQSPARPKFNGLLVASSILAADIRESELRQARIANQFMSELGRGLEDLEPSPSITAGQRASSLGATPLSARVQKPAPDRPLPMAPLMGHPTTHGNVPFQLPLPDVKLATGQQRQEALVNEEPPSLYQSSHAHHHTSPAFNNQDGFGFEFSAMPGPAYSPTQASSASYINEQIPLDPALFSNPTPPTDFDLTSTAYSGIQQQGAVPTGQSLSLPGQTSSLPLTSPPSSSPTASSSVSFGINQPQMGLTWGSGAATQQSPSKPTPPSKKRKKSQQGSEPAQDGKPVKKPRSRKKVPLVEPQQGQPSNIPPGVDQAPLSGPLEAQKNEALPKTQAAIQKAQASDTIAADSSSSGLHAPEP